MAQSPLDAVERNSSAWLKVKAHCEARLDLARKRNDGDHDMERTNRLRGGIAELQHLLTLGEEQMKPNPDDAKFKD